MAPVHHLMDDHSEALPFWRQAGYRAETCLHIDAHLDLGDDTFNPELLEQMARTAPDQLCNWRCPTEVPGSGYHCGNYLYPALKLGLLARLVWVVPPPSGPLLEWVTDELPHWLDPETRELESLSVRQGRVEGSLLGAEFCVCTSDNLPRLPHPVLLDIDTDYFIRLDDDQIWQTPDQLHRQLAPVKVKALTVATSVKGGFCPEEGAGLALELLALYGLEAPAGYRAPRARWQDRAHREMERGHHRKALRLFKQGDPEARETGYFQALLCLHLNDPGGALALLEKALAPNLGDAERARLESLAGSVLNILNLPHQAEPLLRNSQHLWCSADTLLELGRSLRAQGRNEEAAVEFRRALELSRGRLSAVEIESELRSL